MTPKPAIPYRNRSPYGWWLASLLMRLEEEGEDTSNPNRRCLAWENTIILQARDRNHAYRKAVAQGKLEESAGDCRNTTTGREARWIFEGLTSLNPIYEELGDGAEVAWREHRRSAKTLATWVKPKQDLECFIDNDSEME